MTVHDHRSLSMMPSEHVLRLADPAVAMALGGFVREFNRRERAVRIDGLTTFDGYYRDGHYAHDAAWGTGWVIDGRVVPYFHPNRSFHDEVIWLNRNLFYRTDASFEDKLVNAAVVKFYGPSNTLRIATAGTPWPYISFGEYRNDRSYRRRLLGNIDGASARKEQLWGTTELRTSLQTAARDHARANPSEMDDGLSVDEVKTRRMRASDMVHWIAGLAPTWTAFYSGRPTMRSSFDMLTSNRGIGNYYGYHFSSNLARMPGIGAKSLIEAEHRDEFLALGIEHGRLDENDDYVVAGPGAMATLSRLFPTVRVNTASSTPLILAIRDNQEEFFGIKGDSQAERDLLLSTELGRYTTFGCEIACCQFNVFERAAADRRVASQRASAPISVEAGRDVQDDGVFG